MTDIMDRAAVEIGQLYERSNASLVDAVLARLECGRLLAIKKEEVGHGNWLPWLEENAGVLGFSSDRTASRLIRVATNRTLTSDLGSPEEAIEISRQMWGNAPKRLPAEPIDDEPDEEEEYDEPSDAEARKTALLIRAGEALRYACYEGAPDKELAIAADKTARA